MSYNMNMHGMLALRCIIRRPPPSPVERDGKEDPTYQILLHTLGLFAKRCCHAGKKTLKLNLPNLYRQYLLSTNQGRMSRP